MPFNHFSKVSTETTWSHLVHIKQLQIKSNCEMLEYTELVTLLVKQDEFKKICNAIILPDVCYQKYTADSLTTSDGKWRCIVLKDEQSNQKLILYTSGRKYPLYAAICE